MRNSPPEAVFLFSNKEKIEILVTELPKELVKSIAGTISRSTSIKDVSDGNLPLVAFMRVWLSLEMLREIEWR